MIDYPKNDDEAAIFGAREQFPAEVALLPNRIGKRHNDLPRICRIGLKAGFEEEYIVQAILAMNAVSRKTLSEREVRQGLQAAKLPLGSRPRRDVRPYTRAEKGFVAQMIEAGRGTTRDGLRRSCPRLMPTEFNPEAAAVTLVKALWKPEGDDLLDFYWVNGDKRCRGRDSLKMGFDLINYMGWRDKGLYPIPNFLIPNPLSGELAMKKDGSGKGYTCDNAVTKKRNLVLEFDALPEEEQLAFWGGVLKLGTLRVCSLVHSGGKSIHGILEVEGDYDEYVARIKRLVVSADDPAFRADPAVMRPAALTRLAGAVRPETGRLQELLWVRHLW
ncbi:MAG: hypothetical protein MJ240_13735 [Kiritimatiellae bacterium]|nr:hypothetical protein [Kiritimatiellia bacterium]